MEQTTFLSRTYSQGYSAQFLYEAGAVCPYYQPHDIAKKDFEEPKARLTGMQRCSVAGTRTKQSNLDLNILAVISIEQSGSDSIPALHNTLVESEITEDWSTISSSESSPSRASSGAESIIPDFHLHEESYQPGEETSHPWLQSSKILSPLHSTETDSEDEASILLPWDM